MLLLNSDRVVSIDRISEAIWNGHPPATARTQVAICVAELRKALRSAGFRDDVVLTSSPGYMLRRGEHDIDLLSFRTKVAEARALVAKRDIVRATEVFDEALALWRGRPLHDITSAVVEIEVERIQEQKLAVQEERTALHLQLGRHRELISELAPLVEEHPLREQTRAQLMLAQYRAGRRAEAMETFRQGRKHFITEIGLEPGPLLQELHEAILTDDPSVQLPARRTAPAAVSASFPADPLPFSGRDTELSCLDELVSGPAGVGLVTGTAGVGKSGLAVHWAYRSADRFPDGLLYVNLHECCRTPEAADGHETTRSLLAQLGIPAGEIPADPAAAAELYRNRTRGSRILVVLDNVASYQQIRHAVPSGPAATALITSRGQLDELIGTARWLRLQPVGHREAADVLGRLLGGRADAEPRAVAELAELCDRLPAALRIAATKLLAKPHWTIQRLATRLRDPRTRLDHLQHGRESMRTRFQSGYRRLAPDAAEVFRGLGALPAAEFTLQDVTAELRLAPDEAENLVENLVDAHFLEGSCGLDADEVHYRFLPLMGVFAQELHRVDVRAAEEAAGSRRRARTCVPELRFAI